MLKQKRLAEQKARAQMATLPSAAADRTPRKSVSASPVASSPRNTAATGKKSQGQQQPQQPSSVPGHRLNASIVLDPSCGIDDDLDQETYGYGYGSSGQSTMRQQQLRRRRRSQSALTALAWFLVACLVGWWAFTRWKANAF